MGQGAKYISLSYLVSFKRGISNGHLAKEKLFLRDCLSPFRPLKGKPEPALVSLLGDGRGWLLMLLIMAAMIAAPSHLMAQDGGDLVNPPDSSLNSTVHTSNRIPRPDTVTQSLSSFARDSTDTLSHTASTKKFLHSARKAAYLSAVLPGLGQAYNKKYWKIPIIYAGFGGFGYALYYTVSNFNGYKNAYRQQVAYQPNPYASFNGASDAATLKTYRDYYKKYVDISSIGIAVWYFLNVIDATVDAHLTGWNMKDDLSVTWNPTVISSPNYNTAALGLSVALHF